MKSLEDSIDLPETARLECRGIVQAAQLVTSSGVIHSAVNVEPGCTILQFLSINQVLQNCGIMHGKTFVEGFDSLSQFSPAPTQTAQPPQFQLAPQPKKTKKDGERETNKNEKRDPENTSLSVALARRNKMCGRTKHLRGIKTEINGALMALPYTLRQSTIGKCNLVLFYFVFAKIGYSRYRKGV